MVSYWSKYSPRKCTILSQTFVRGLSVWPNGHVIYVSNSKNKIRIMLSRRRKSKHLVFHMSKFDKTQWEINSEQQNISDKNNNEIDLKKTIFKQQLGCRFDIMDNISSCFSILTYAIIYVFIHHISVWLYLYFLNILYFFKYSCTNIFHRRSPYTFYHHRCNMAFIEPMHHNKPNITYLLTVYHHKPSSELFRIS